MDAALQESADYPDLLEEHKLTMAERKALPKSAFVFPERAPAIGAYPIHDKQHALAALAYSKGTKDEARVRAAVHARYPGIGISHKLAASAEVAIKGALDEAVGSLRKATIHKHGLERKKGPADNWVEKTGPGGKRGQLPAYIQHVALAIRKKRGLGSTSQAIRIAIGVIRRWAAGGGNVDAETKAAAEKAMVEWEAMKLKNKTRKFGKAAKAVAEAHAEADLVATEAILLAEAESPYDPDEILAGKVPVELR
jgi:hypothetical protein